MTEIRETRAEISKRENQDGLNGPMRRLDLSFHFTIHCRRGCYATRGKIVDYS